jgi:hypothetical protein
MGITVPKKSKRSLVKEIEDLTRSSLSSGDPPSEKVMSRLERMARLLEIHELFRPPPKRWPVIAILVSILLIVTSLLYFRLGRTEIELDLNVGEISFKLLGKNEQIITDAFEISEIDISGLDEIRLPSGFQSNQTVQNSTVQIVSSVRQEGRGKLTLASLILPAETTVTIKHGDIPNEFLFIFKGQPVGVNITAQGLGQFSVLNDLPREYEFTTPKVFRFNSGHDGLRLHLLFTDATKLRFYSRIDVQSLTFSSIEHFADVGRTLYREVSSVKDGTLYYEALKGQRTTLRAGEPIHFNQSEGFIRELRLYADRISLKFHGHVRGMVTGTIENPINLMPTWLEYLRANHSLAILWGSVVSIFSLVLVVLRWLRVLK